MVQAPDAASVLGSATATDLSGIDELAQGEYRRSVVEAMPRDYVTMYHPDGTVSTVQLPPLGKNGKNRGVRQQKILHYVMNKRRNGQQWWFASPPPGWVPSPLPYRCPVAGCTRTGGVPDLLNLWRHINQKHPGEVELYQGVMNAIKARLAAAVPADLQALLDGTDEAPEQEGVSFTDADTALAEDAQIMTAAVSPDTFEGNPYECNDCDWKPKPGAQQPRAALMMHRRHRHQDEV